jgi:import inner membrane translocase subunit TIM50
MDADPIIRKLDPFRLVMWPLFREATRFEKGEYIKVCSHRLASKVTLANILRTFPTSTVTFPKSS